MGHPKLDEFCRASSFRPDFLRACQRVFRDEVNPIFDQVETLRQENADLKAQVEKLSKRKPVAA
jgi:hypothetical protein